MRVCCKKSGRSNKWNQPDFRVTIVTRRTAMLPMPMADFNAIAQELADSGGRVKVLWQRPESLAFIARGREYRSEFHINPSDEVMYMVRGDMNLHYRTPEGKEDIAVLKEGT